MQETYSSLVKHCSSQRKETHKGADENLLKVQSLTHQVLEGKSGIIKGIEMLHLHNATQKSQKVFVHVPSEICAHEVEEIGMISSYFFSILDFCHIFLMELIWMQHFSSHGIWQFQLMQSWGFISHVYKIWCAQYAI